MGKKRKSKPPQEENPANQIVEAELERTKALREEAFRLQKRVEESKRGKRQGFSGKE